MVNNILDNAKKIFFIGIGGSGTYPIVQILNSWGYKISGSDNNTGDTIDQELAMGIDVKIGHDYNNVTKDIDAVIYSAAIFPDNPELLAAKDLGIPTVTRAEALGYITRKFSSAISVSGTHGKTSTSAMLTQILVESGKNPTAVIGGKLPLINGYGIAGNSDIMVTEACEYKETFLEIHTDIAVILNVDEDHLEYFKNLDNIIKSFNKFANNAKKCVIVNGDDPNSLKAVEGLTVPVITFGFAEDNDYCAQNIEKISPVSTKFDLCYKGNILIEITINVPGYHNVYNALAASVTALQVGVTIDEIADSIVNFKGAGRRFEMLGTVDDVHIADDYAHHPKEISVTLDAAKKMGFNKIWAVFQPFTYSRTYLLLDDFAKALSIADHVVLAEIMGGREKNTYDIHTKDLAVKIDNSVYFKDFKEIADYVMTHAEPNDLVITLGCGDIYKCAKLMLNYNK